MDKINPNCARCEHAIIRTYVDGGQQITCSVDYKEMKNYLMGLTQCSKFLESGKEGKGKKEKAS